MSLVNVWRGRRGEERLLELITVRNYLACLPGFRKPSGRRRRRREAACHLRVRGIQANGPGFAKEGLCPQRFIICYHSVHNVILKRTIYPRDKGGQTATLDAKEQGEVEDFHGG